MRILIISTFFPPLNSIASHRPYSWAKYWSQAGHDVTVLTTPKQEGLPVNLALPLEGFKIIEVEGPRILKKLKSHYNTNISSDKTASSWKQCFKQKLIEGFNLLRSKTGIFSSCRMPDFADLWIRPAIKAARQEEPWDLIVSTAGPYAVHVVAVALKKSGHGKKWVADYRDNWSHSYVYPGLFPFNKFEIFLERRLLRHADVITTVSDPYAVLFATKNKGKRVFAIENGFDPDDFQQVDSRPIFPDDGKYRIVYTGSFYHHWNPIPLFEAIVTMRESFSDQKLLERLEVHFAGPNQRQVPELIEKYGIRDYISVRGFVSRQDALRMQRDAHDLLFFAWHNPSLDGCLTGKLFEYLNSGTHIISISNGLEASQKLILEAKAGTIFTTSSEIVDFLRKRLAMPIKVNNVVDSDLLKRYDRRHLAMKFLKVIDE